MRWRDEKERVGGVLYTKWHRVTSDDRNNNMVHLRAYKEVRKWEKKNLKYC